MEYQESYYFVTKKMGNPIIFEVSNALLNTNNHGRIDCPVTISVTHLGPEAYIPLLMDLVIQPFIIFLNDTANPGSRGFSNLAILG